MGTNLRDMSVIVIAVICLGLLVMGVNSHNRIADALGLEIELTGGSGINVSRLGDGSYEIALSSGNYTEVPIWAETSVTATADTWLDTDATLATLSTFEVVRVRGDGHHIDIPVSRIMGLTAGTAESTIGTDEYAVVITHTTDSSDSDGLRLVYLGRDDDSLLVGFEAALSAADPHTDILVLR